MRINTNVSALNTLRTLGSSEKGLARSIGRLSSGFRINQAKDDAAGLGIANKMRADLRSMRQASRNAEQGASVLQVAEGGAQTISQIVERMKELATQSASDNTDGSGRLRIQQEFAELQAEVTRVVSTTKFQDSVLLNGTQGTYVSADTLAGAASSVSISGAVAAVYTFTQTGSVIEVTNDGDSSSQAVDVADAGAQSIRFDAFGITLNVDATFALADASVSGTVTVSGGSTSFMVSSSGAYGAADTVGLSSLNLTLATLGLDSDTLGTKAGAEAALGHLDTAIGTISDVFASIGAAQNRIEYAQQNTDAAVENISAAESVIRDVDMAAEVTQMTKYQILQQAGTAMLAQANQAPQSVLSLLR